MRKDQVFKNLLLLILTYMISACNEKPVVVKPSAFIDDNTCAAPCWAGVNPGITTFNEAQELIDSSEYITDRGSTEYVVDKDRSQLRWFFPSSYSERYGTAHILNGIVQLIEFEYEHGPTFNDIVEQFGEPDKVSAMVHYADCGYAHISIKYSQIGLVASKYMGCIHLDTGYIRPDPEDRITDIHLFIPGTYDDLVTPGKVVLVIEYGHLTDSLQEWQGFVDVPLYFPYGH